jgi:hypothetical protein
MFLFHFYSGLIIAKVIQEDLATSDLFILDCDSFGCPLIIFLLLLLVLYLVLFISTYRRLLDVDDVDAIVEQLTSSSCTTVAKSVHEKVPSCIADDRRRIINKVDGCWYALLTISSGIVEAVVVVVVVDEVVILIFLY